jgi:hypothetical protein
MAKTAQLSVTAQVGLALATLLLFSAIATIVGYLAQTEVRQKIAAFASEPVEVSGTVTNKRIDIVRPSNGGIWVYWLQLEFKTEDGSTLNQSIQVTDTVFNQYQVGGQVPVTYVKSKPEWFFVPGEQPTERSARIMSAMQNYGFAAAILSAAGLIIFFFVTRGGGTAEGGEPRLPQSAAGAVRTTGARSQFGTRRG